MAHRPRRRAFSLEERVFDARPPWVHSRELLLGSLLIRDDRHHPSCAVPSEPSCGHGDRLNLVSLINPHFVLSDARGRLETWNLEGSTTSRAETSGNGVISLVTVFRHDD